MTDEEKQQHDVAAAGQEWKFNPLDNTAIACWILADFLLTSKGGDRYLLTPEQAAAMDVARRRAVGS